MKSKTVWLSLMTGIMLLSVMLVPRVFAVGEALHVSIDPAMPDSTAIASVSITNVGDIEDFSLELSFASGTTLSLQSADWFIRSADYFPSQVFPGSYDLNNYIASTAKTKIYITGFKPNGSTGNIGTIAFKVNSLAVAGDTQLLSLSGKYYSKSEQVVKTFLPVAATFTVGASSPKYLLTVKKQGTGTGSLTSNETPQGISCGSDCTGSYNAGAVVTLTAKPEMNSKLAGWTGCVVQADPAQCKVTMNKAKTVTVTFNAATPPTVVTLTPSVLVSAPNVAQTFSAIYSDADGYADINQAFLRVHTAANGIYLRYDRTTNKLYLYNDAGTATVGSCTPGVTKTLTNKQGTLNCAQTIVVSSGNNLSVNWNITPKLAFASATAKQVRMMAKDNEALNSGWVVNGSWTILAANTAPTIGTLSPASAASAAGAAKTYTAVYSDADGFANLKTVDFLVSTDGRTASAIFVRYNRTLNKLYLFNNAGTGLVNGSCTPGGTGTLSNAQGTLICSGTSVTSSVNNLTLKWRITPKAGFIGAKQLRLRAIDNSDASSGWVKKGTWTIAAASVAAVADEVYKTIHYGMIDSGPYVTVTEDRLVEDREVIGDIDAGLNEMKLSVRKSDGLGNGNLSGPFTIIQQTSQGADRYEAEFDGNGLSMVEEAGRDSSFTLPYAVNQDGTVELGDYTGQFGPNSGVIVLTTPEATAKPEILVGIRQGNRIGNEILSGEYEKISMAGGHVSKVLVVFDGNGVWQSSGMSGSYLVEVNGVVSIFGIKGTVSENGDVVTLDDAESGITILVKRILVDK